MKLNHKEIIEQLEQFLRIQPRAEFSEQSKSLILSSSRLSPELATPTSWVTRLQYGMSSVLRIGSFVSVGLSILIISLYATRELSPVLFPGLSPQSITAEAEMLTSSMNIELSRLGYFDTASQESSAALKQLSQKQLNHLNDTIIGSEVITIQKSTQSSPDETSQINNLINQLSN